MYICPCPNAQMTKFQNSKNSNQPIFNRPWICLGLLSLLDPQFSKVPCSTCGQFPSSSFSHSQLLKGWPWSTDGHFPSCCFSSQLARSNISKDDLCVLNPITTIKTKPNRSNQTNLTEPTKLNQTDQTDQTKPTKPN